MDPTLKAIIAIRDEMRAFRTETRTTLGQHSHRLNLIEVTIGSVQLMVATVDLSDRALPVNVTLEAWNPFIPLNDKPQMAMGALPKPSLLAAMKDVLKVD